MYITHNHNTITSNFCNLFSLKCGTKSNISCLSSIVRPHHLQSIIIIVHICNHQHEQKVFLKITVHIFLYAHATCQCGMPPKSRNMSHRGRPLLDNGSVTFPYHCLGDNLTCSRGNAYLTDRYHGNKSLNSGISAVSKTLAAAVSEYRKLNPLFGDADTDRES
jgi:hypothetical protein